MKILQNPRHSEWRRNHSLGVFNKSLFAEMFPLPGLGSMDSCHHILCVVNRRLHYARAVWVVNQYAGFGELQGNAEHLRKSHRAAHKGVGIASRVMVSVWQRDPEHLSVLLL